MTVDLGLKSETPTSSPRFNWADPFILEDELTEDERLILRTARSFAQERLMTGITEANREGNFDRSIMTEMGTLGLLGSNLQGYGCAGASAVSYGLIAREIERVDSAYRSCLSVQSSLVMWPIYTYGTETQKQRFIPALAKGELIGSFGLTEPDYGSDPGGMLARSKNTDGGYILNGTKTWMKAIKYVALLSKEIWTGLPHPKLKVSFL